MRSTVTRLLTGLAGEGLVRVVALNGSAIGGLALVLLAAGDEEGGSAAGHGQDSNADKDPHPHGDGTVLALHLVVHRVGEGDLVALDLAAVGLSDLAGEGYRVVQLKTRYRIGSARAAAGRGIDDVLALLVGDSLGVGNLPGSLNSAGAGVAFLLEGELGVLVVVAGAELVEAICGAGVFGQCLDAG